MEPITEETYKLLANRIRLHSLRMIHRAGSAHIGSCLSIADILAVLYGGNLRLNSGIADWEERDRVIVSKGHAAAAVYAVLAECGFIQKEILDDFLQDGSRLGGHITHDIPGIEVSTGALGHGQAIGCGMAVAALHDRRPYRVFVVMSDAECDEGSTWEASLFAAHHKLENLIFIIDCNNAQGLGFAEDILNLEPLAQKWRSFGWNTVEVDGHDVGMIDRAIKEIPLERGCPSVIIAHTVKGKGVSYMENKFESHYQPPDDIMFRDALKELGATE